MIVVGGVSGVLQGAPVSTLDLDLVHERSPENVARVLGALAELDARYRDLTGRVLRPEATAFAGPGHHLLITSAGPIDMLGQIDDDRRFEDLLPESDELSLGDFTIRVLSLAALIRGKERSSREKDRAMLPTLRRTLTTRDE